MRIICNRDSQQGLTLLELMIVIFVVSILSMVALPAYQDYRVRAEVSKDLGVVNKAKTNVAEFYTLNGRLPNSNSEAGFDNFSMANFKLFIGAMPNPGTIIVVYSVQEIPELDGWEILNFVPTVVNGRLKWDCTIGGSMPNRYRPANCRR